MKEPNFIQMVRNSVRDIDITKEDPSIDVYLKNKKEQIKGKFGMKAADFILERSMLSTGTGAAIAEPYSRVGLAKIPFQILWREIGCNFIDNFSYAASIPLCDVIPTATFKAESDPGSPVEPQLLTSLTAQWRELITALSVSKKLFIHSDSGDPKEMKRSDFLLALLYAAMDYRIDYALFNGNGTTEPTGLKINANVSTASATSFTKTIAANIKKASRNSRAKGQCYWCMHPDTAAELEGRPLEPGSGRFIIEDNKLNGDPVAVSVQIGLTDIFYGPFEMVNILQFGVTGITINPFSVNGTVTLVPFELIDILVQNPSAFVYASNFS